MFTTLLTLFVSIAGAVEGHFAYKGDQTVVSSVRSETVYPKSKAGKQRIQDLQNDGYSCQSKLQFVQCKKLFMNTGDIPAQITHATPSAENVTFDSVQVMDLVGQGDSIAFYEATQNVTVDGVTYDLVKYLERPDLVKATVGNPNESDNYHSFIVNTESISVLDSIHITESQWAFTTYHVEFFLPKQ